MSNQFVHTSTISPSTCYFPPSHQHKYRVTLPLRLKKKGRFHLVFSMAFASGLMPNQSSKRRLFKKIIHQLVVQKNKQRMTQYARISRTRVGTISLSKSSLSSQPTNPWELHVIDVMFQSYQNGKYQPSQKMGSRKVLCRISLWTNCNTSVHLSNINSHVRPEIQRKFHMLLLY